MCSWSLQAHVGLALGSCAFYPAFRTTCPTLGPPPWLAGVPSKEVAWAGKTEGAVQAVMAKMRAPRLFRLTLHGMVPCPLLGVGRGENEGLLTWALEGRRSEG